MKLRFFIDPETGTPHIHNHVLTKTKSKRFWGNPGEDSVGREGVRTAIGRTRDGRYLRIVYVPDPDPESVLSSQPMS